MTKRAKQWMKVLETFQEQRAKRVEKGICYAIEHTDLGVIECDFLKADIDYIFERESDCIGWVFGWPSEGRTVPRIRKLQADERETAICFLIAMNS